MNFIDLFSGAGELSEGFVDSSAHVEIDKHACKTIVTRLVYHQLKQNGGMKFYYDYILGKIDRNNFRR